MKSNLQNQVKFWNLTMIFASSSHQQKLDMKKSTLKLSFQDLKIIYVGWNSLRLQETEINPIVSVEYFYTQIATWIKVGVRMIFCGSDFLETYFLAMLLQFIFTF